MLRLAEIETFVAANFSRSTVYDSQPWMHNRPMCMWAKKKKKKKKELYLYSLVSVFEDKHSELQPAENNTGIVTMLHSSNDLSEKSQSFCFLEAPTGPHVGMQITMVGLEEDVRLRFTQQHLFYLVYMLVMSNGPIRR